jgi:hypothetical protein
MASKKREYVNNANLLAALMDYKKAKLIAGGLGLEPPPIPEYIGECFLKIATNLAQKPNFYRYTYKDEMIGDALLNCVAYMDNFDPEKSKNPFSYFTQFIYYAFLRRIEGEKKQTYIKCKIMEKADFQGFDVALGDEGRYKNTYVEYISENMDEVIGAFELKKKKAKEKKIVGLDKYIGDPVDDAGGS